MSHYNTTIYPDITDGNISDQYSSTMFDYDDNGTAWYNAINGSSPYVDFWYAAGPDYDTWSHPTQTGFPGSGGALNGVNFFIDAAGDIFVIRATWDTATWRYLVARGVFTPGSPGSIAWTSSAETATTGNVQPERVDIIKQGDYIHIMWIQSASDVAYYNRITHNGTSFGSWVGESQISSNENIYEFHNTHSFNFNHLAADPKTVNTGTNVGHVYVSWVDSVNALLYVKRLQNTGAGTWSWDTTQSTSVNFGSGLVRGSRACWNGSKLYTAVRQGGNALKIYSVDLDGSTFGSSATYQSAAYSLGSDADTQQTTVYDPNNPTSLYIIDMGTLDNSGIVQMHYDTSGGWSTWPTYVAPQSGNSNINDVHVMGRSLMPSDSMGLVGTTIAAGNYADYMFYRWGKDATRPYQPDWVQPVAINASEATIRKSWSVSAALTLEWTFDVPGGDTTTQNAYAIRRYRSKNLLTSYDFDPTFESSTFDWSPSASNLTVSRANDQADASTWSMKLTSSVASNFYARWDPITRTGGGAWFVNGDKAYTNDNLYKWGSALTKRAGGDNNRMRGSARMRWTGAFPDSSYVRCNTMHVSRTYRYLNTYIQYLGGQSADTWYTVSTNTTGSVVPPNITERDGCVVYMPGSYAWQSTSSSIWTDNWNMGIQDGNGNDEYDSAATPGTTDWWNGSGWTTQEAPIWITSSSKSVSLPTGWGIQDETSLSFQVYVRNTKGVTSMGSIPVFVTPVAGINETGREVTVASTITATDIFSNEEFTEVTVASTIDITDSLVLTEPTSEITVASTIDISELYVVAPTWEGMPRFTRFGHTTTWNAPDQTKWQIVVNQGSNVYDTGEISDTQQSYKMTWGIRGKAKVTWRTWRGAVLVEQTAYTIFTAEANPQPYRPRTIATKLE